MKRGRLRVFLLLALATAVASCLTPGSQPKSAANAPTQPTPPTFLDAWGDPLPEQLIGLPYRPAPWHERPKQWAEDGACLASAPARGGDTVATEGTDLIIRTIQRSDGWYQLLKVGVAVDRTVLGSSERAGRAGVQAPDQFVQVPGVAVGAHTVSVVYLLQGNGTGEYAYMRGFQYKVRSSHSFTVAPAQTTCISILLYFNNSDPRLPANERPQVDFREERAPLVVKGEGPGS